MRIARGSGGCDTSCMATYPLVAAQGLLADSSAAWGDDDSRPQADHLSDTDQWIARLEKLKTESKNAMENVMNEAKNGGTASMTSLSTAVGDKMLAELIVGVVVGLVASLLLCFLVFYCTKPAHRRRLLGSPGNNRWV